MTLAKFLECDVKFDDDVFELFFCDIRAEEYQRDAIADHQSTMQEIQL